MTRPVYVRCQSANAPRAKVRAAAGAEYDVLEVQRFGDKPNLLAESIGPQIFENLSSISRDLFDVACYVYAADRLISRGTEKDLGDRWRRKLVFALPVRNPKTWQKPEVKGALCEALSFLTGDYFDFLFCRGVTKEQEQQEFDFRQMGDANAVCLFSGGMDSFAGVLRETTVEKNRPLLVSHWPLPRAKSRQDRLISLLRERIPNWRFPCAQALIHLRGVDHAEHTQRSRSFLYLALAVAVARELHINNLRIYENGIVAINLPIWRQSVGGMDTRTAHPRFIMLFQKFARLLLDTPINVENPFLNMTRADVAQLLEQLGYADLIEATTSCSRVYFMPEASQHCGVCSQCVDRRFALEATGLQDCEPRGFYLNDIFEESLSEIESKRGWTTSKARAMAVGYVRSALEMDRMSLPKFIGEYPEVYDAAGCFHPTAQEALLSIYKLHRRHSDAVLRVLRARISTSADGLAKGIIHRDSLIGIVASQEHLAEPISLYANRIAEELEANLPLTFQSRRPNKEDEVQDAAQAILNAARIRLDREFPQLSYAVVTGVKGDFTSPDQSLFVEIKYPRKPHRTVNKIVGEMTAKILQYGERGGSVLFVVYDYNRLIPDRQGFCDQFQKYEGIYIRVIV